MTTKDTDTDASTEERTLAELRQASEAAEDAARKAKAALLERAVKDAMASTKYGHLSAVAREADIASQYLRDLIEKDHPGWLDRAAEERKAAKAATPRGRKTARAA
ncbi:hypothetical protein QQY66_49150 [Streptomyces sp. DG2A-72]|uniref:hypothetical protein n=1 Tax=Streptomyces sp. DG2A-72 TaxID=3051386 RepID=UPI00265C072C|nr:hypothetical protein [Streptomyces sp. DG2A-72]MDO0939282.1 hypothetical protein [Streptomyces sp. DG2A-72]